MEFEFDEQKRRRILAERDLDIRHAALIFADHVLTHPDSRRDYGEERFVSVGMVDGDCFVVVHTERNGRLRIITAWEGGRGERQRYQDDLARRTASDEGAG